MSKRNVRQDAIDAVYAVCAEVGLENLTTKRISQQAHASEAMIYYHFKSKRELLEGAFLAIHEEIDALFKRAFAERSFSLAADTYTVCLETWLLYYGYWRDNPEKTAFYDCNRCCRFFVHFAANCFCFKPADGYISQIIYASSKFVNFWRLSRIRLKCQGVGVGRKYGY